MPTRFALWLALVALALVSCDAEKDSTSSAINAPIIIQAMSKVARANDFKVKSLDDVTKKPFKLHNLTPKELESMFTKELMSPKDQTLSFRQPETTVEMSTPSTIPPTTEDSSSLPTTESVTMTNEDPIATPMATETSSLWTSLFSFLDEVSTQGASDPSPSSQSPTVPVASSASSDVSDVVSEVPLGNFVRFLQTLGMMSTEMPKNNEEQTGEVSALFHDSSTGPEAAEEVDHHSRFARHIPFENFTEADVAYSHDQDDAEVEEMEEEDEEADMKGEEREEEEKMMERSNDEQSRTTKMPMTTKPYPLPLPIDLSKLVNMKQDKVVNYQSDTLPVQNKDTKLDAALLARVPLYFQGAGSQLNREQPMFLSPALPHLPFPSNFPLDFYSYLAMMLKQQQPNSAHTPQLPLPNLLLPNVPIVNYSKPILPPQPSDSEKMVNPLNTFYSKSYKPDKLSADMKNDNKDDSSKELYPAESAPEKVSAKKPEESDYEYEYVYYYYDEDDPNNKTMVVKPAASVKAKSDSRKPSDSESGRAENSLTATHAPKTTLAAEGRSIPHASNKPLPLSEGTDLSRDKWKQDHEGKMAVTSSTLHPVTVPSLPRDPFIPGPESPVLFLGIQKESGSPMMDSFHHSTRDPANLVSLYAFSKGLQDVNDERLKPYTYRPPGTLASFTAFPNEATENGFQLSDALLSHNPVFDSLVNVTETEGEENDPTQKSSPLANSVRSKPVLPSVRTDSSLGGKPLNSRSTTTTTTPEPTTTTTKAPKSNRGRRPNSKTTSASGEITTKAPTRVNSRRNNGRRKNKETTTAEPNEDDHATTITEKTSRRNNNRKTKTRTTTPTASTTRTTSERKSPRRNKSSTRPSRTKSRTTTTTTTTTASPTTSGNGDSSNHVTSAPAPKRLSNLFPRRRGPTTSTTPQPTEEEAEEKKEEHEETTTTARPTTVAAPKTTTTKPTTTLPPSSSLAIGETEVVKPDDEEDLPEEEKPTEPPKTPLIRFRPLRPALRTTTTVEPESV